MIDWALEKYTRQYKNENMNETSNNRKYYRGTGQKKRNCYKKKEKSLIKR